MVVVLSVALLCGQVLEHGAKTAVDIEHPETGDVLLWAGENFTPENICLFVSLGMDRFYILGNA